MQERDTLSLTEEQARDFDQVWASQSDEVDYTHWTAGEPANQIQLAFRSHWNLFKELMGPDFAGTRSLELGAGRGSMSAYFAANGFDATLLDLSPSAMETAERIFSRNGLKGTFLVGDALNTGLPDGCQDVIVSIGLLEHIEDLEAALTEEVRLLAPGGLLLCYVVPERPENVQKDYNVVCKILALYDEALRGKREAGAKPDLYRSDADSSVYLEILSRLPMRGVQASGVYPFPMISPSPTFPFTLMPPPMETLLVADFTKRLEERREAFDRNPWLCDEEVGQAFLVWGFKE